MKRFFVVVFLSAIFGVSASAKVFDNAESIVENFLDKGSYIKVVKDKNNVIYYSRCTVSGINVDEDDLEIFTIGPVEYEKSYNSSYNVKKWNFESDENGNIIITSKKK